MLFLLANYIGLGFTVLYEDGFFYRQSYAFTCIIFCTQNSQVTAATPPGSTTSSPNSTIYTPGSTTSDLAPTNSTSLSPQDFVRISAGNLLVWPKQDRFLHLFHLTNLALSKIVCLSAYRWLICNGKECCWRLTSCTFLGNKDMLLEARQLLGDC